MNTIRPSKIQWYIRRLASMSLGEIGSRVRQRALIEYEKRRTASRNSLFEQGIVTAEAWDRYVNEQGFRFFFTWSQRDQLIRTSRARFPEGYEATLQSADKLRQHRIRLFDRELDLGHEILWQRDPLTRRDWPSRFWADLDIRDGQTIGGVKWVWELNRHHHLVTLGKAFFLTDEERYAEEVCAQLIGWIRSNPPGIGVNWASPLEVAVRTINWTWALAFIRRASVLTKDLFGIIQRSVVTQADHVLRHLSAHSSANNHLVGEASGLAFIGLSFPWLSHAGKWRNTGLRILARELERQIHPDGVPAEQAFHYLTFVLDLNLLAWQLAQLNGLAVPQIWTDRLAAACSFLCHVMDECGNAPSIGDSDDGCTVRLDDRREVNDCRSILATAAVLLDRPDLKVRAGQWDEKSHWLLGPPGLAAFESLSTEEPALESHAFEKGGYCVMRAPRCVIVFDCGPFGFLSPASHGHADALSVAISLRGQPIFIDPGTYAYQEGGEWRDYLRSTAAHNTVVVDGRSQSEIWGQFLWGRKANACLLRWESTPDYDLAIACHDGYQRMGVTHQRILLFHKPHWLIVVDRLLGDGVHDYEQLWHMPSDCEVKVGCEHTELTVGAERGAFIPLDMPGAKCVVRRGDVSPMQGWVSRRYGQIAPSPVVSFLGKSSLPVQLVIALHLAPIPSDTAVPRLKERMLHFVNGLTDGARRRDVQASVLEPILRSDHLQVRGD